MNVSTSRSRAGNPFLETGTCWIRDGRMLGDLMGRICRRRVFGRRVLRWDGF